MNKAIPLGAMGPADTASRFALPERLARPHLSALKKAGLRPHVEIAQDDGELKVPVTVLSAKRAGRLWDAVCLALGLLGRSVQETTFIVCRGDRGKVPLLLFPVPEVESHQEGKTPDNESEVLGDAVTISVFEEVLSRFSAMVGGLRVHLHYGYSAGVATPCPSAPDELHFFTSCGPPGEYRVVYMRSAYGIPFHKTWQDVVVRAPAKGRGTVAKDEKGKETLQVLGGNIYLFPPVMTAFTLSGATLFERLVSEGWAAFRRAGSGGTDGGSVIDSLDTAAEQSAEWTEGVKRSIRQNIDLFDREIERHQVELMRAQQNRQRFVMMQRALEDSPSFAALRDRLPSEFLRIVKMPEVEDLSIVDGGIHVRTKCLIAEHDGRRYRLGSYVIRLGDANFLAVWSDVPAHPRGINHPHISKSGAECFGNATKAIARFGGEFRYADLVAMVVRWLTKGYSPHLADTPLEEWPREDVAAAADDGGNMNDAVALVAAGRMEAALDKVLADTFQEEE